MAVTTKEELAQLRRDRVLLNPYEDFLEAEGIPVIEDFGVDMIAAELGRWDRFDCDGAAVQLKGRGSYCSIFVYELAPGAKTAPVKHLFEETFYVLEGHGSTVIENAEGQKHTFEWGPKSVFALPLNAKFQHFNGSGTEPARLSSVHNMPMMMNLYHSESFIFDNPASFTEREGAANYFAGEGELTPIRPGRILWETNFVPNISTFELPAWENRGVGATNMQFILADGVMGAHASEMPVGTYKKGHRHGPGLHIFMVHGEGYSLLWYEGDEDYVRVEWKHGVAFAPPNNMFHQHFDTSQDPARYLAVGIGSKRYPLIQLRRAGSTNNRSDVSIKKGGRQIEYEDQDPRIHEMWLREIQGTGIRSRMGEKFDEDAILAKIAAEKENA